MTAQESAFKQISELVKDFKENESKFLSSDYSEADVRKDFIDKFFNALGWDVYHNEQKNPYEQEVKIEKGIFIGKAQKRADYAFYIAPNFKEVRFYVEAKKPIRNLSNPDDYFQSCRYGWNAGTQITFLFDFEELHILDCRTRPDIATILNNKIKQYHYSQYLNEEKFAEIYWLLSREAVADNSLEKFADSLPKPRGKAVQKGLFKGGYQSIDEAFLIELDEIRDALAKSFKKANPHLESEELTEMTQRTIDRLVFIRFLEDKLIEPHHYVSEFGNSKTAWKDFKTASRQLDAKYNGVVFKKHFIDNDNFIEPDDKTFSQICEELAHVNSPYNFDIIPIHILGSIYERFLGKVVVATEKRVRIEEKPEVRKAGGVYYTPQYIVNYIVDNTVGKLIEGKTPNEIAKLKFADISCGSGSFLITVFDRLLEYHRKWYQENPAQAKKDGCYFQEGKWILSLKQKTKILTNNIFGVDLDAQAVEVTQVSLYLKLLEDETTATTQDTWVMFKEQLLPNLTNNIICGNSLIETNFLEGYLFDRKEELKLRPMNFTDTFPDIMKKGGFDAIVGNPPWVFTKYVDWGELTKNYISDKYLQIQSKSEGRARQSGKINLFAIFMVRSIELLKKDALFSFIIPNNILRTTIYDTVRYKLLVNTRIKTIVDLKTDIFKGVTASTVIITFSKGFKKNNQIEIIDNEQDSKYIKEVSCVLNQDNFIENTSYAFNIFSHNQYIDITNKMNACNSFLKIFCVDIIEGIVAHKHLISDVNVSNSFPLLEGKRIKKYLVQTPLKHIIWNKKEIHRTRPDYLWDAKVKLVIQRISGGYRPIVAALDTKKIKSFASVNNLLLKEIYENYYNYILALLNSSLVNFYYSTNFSNRSMLTVNISKTYLEQIPVPLPNKENEIIIQKIMILVNQIIDTKKFSVSVKTENEKEYLEKKCETLDRQIDKLVYELYGLTEEEIKIVEESFNK